MATYPPNQTTPARGSGNYVWNWLSSPLKKFAAALQPYLGGGGISDPVNITSAALANLGKNNSLVPGQTYRVTDYQSVNWLNGQDQARYGVVDNPVVGYNPKAIHTGDIEPILIKAITTNRFDSVAYSEKYTDDVLNYDPYVQTLSATDATINNTVLLPNGNTVSGFDLQWDGTNVYIDMPAGYPVEFGAFLEIYAEFDGNNQYMDFNWETVRPGVNYQSQAGYTVSSFNNNINAVVSSDGMKIIIEGLTFANFQDYDADTLYVYVLTYEFPAYGWVRRRTNDNLQISLGVDWRNFKHRRYEVDMTGEITFFPTIAPVYMACGPDIFGWGQPNPALYTGLYKDYRIFGNTPGGYTDCYNFKHQGEGAPFFWYWMGAFDNVVFVAEEMANSFIQDFNLDGYYFRDITFYDSYTTKCNVCQMYSMTVFGSCNNIQIDLIQSGALNGMNNVNGSVGGYSFGNCANATVLPSSTYSKTLYIDAGNLKLMRIVSGVVTINNITD